jgi:hypothetical protein
MGDEGNGDLAGGDAETHADDPGQGDGGGRHRPLVIAGSHGSPTEMLASCRCGGQREGCGKMPQGISGRGGPRASTRGRH